MAQHRPQRLLGDAGAVGRLHPAQAFLASADRVAHRLDLVCRFDRAREVEEREPVDRGTRPSARQRCRAGEIDPVVRDAVAAAVLADERRDLARKGRSPPTAAFEPAAM